MAQIDTGCSKTDADTKTSTPSNLHLF